MTIFTKDFIKDPNAILDYEVDWTLWLGTDTISTSAWTIPTGITKTTDSIVSGNLKTIVWLSGGTVQSDYECYNTIVTAGGRTARSMIKIQIR